MNLLLFPASMGFFEFCPPHTCFFFSQKQKNLKLKSVKRSLKISLNSPEKLE
jgi:hypothetical protein